MIEVSATTVSTSNADDLAFEALVDACTLTQELDVRIVGGQMTALLCTAFPSPRTVFRRTADADAALGTELAATGRVHDLLEAAGYEATSGNSYLRAGRQIDLLVPAPTGRFQVEDLGGRAFDAAPGVSLALAAPPITVHVDVTLTDGTALRFDARVPTVEAAVVLKATSYASRRVAKDLTDLHNLLLIVDEREPATIGGWQLGTAASGSRGDAQRALASIASSASRLRSRGALDIEPHVLVSLIRTHVALPE